VRAQDGHHVGGNTQGFGQGDAGAGAHGLPRLTATPSEIGTGWARIHSSAIWAISLPGSGCHIFWVHPVRADQRPCLSLVLPGRVNLAFIFQVPTPGVAVIVSFQTRPSVMRWS
jgi:hypothetical protein